jgi:hypothetical protein
MRAPALFCYENGTTEVPVSDWYNIAKAHVVAQTAIIVLWFIYNKLSFLVLRIKKKQTRESIGGRKKNTTPTTPGYLRR